MKGNGVWAHYDKFGFQYAICQICGQHCPDLRPLARHMLYNKSSSRNEHHKLIEQLTGKTITQLRSKGGLGILENALTSELHRVKTNFRKKAVHFVKKLGLEKKCVHCGSTDQLELDHIDGNALNNQISNLRYLCFPCHHASHSIFGRRNEYRRCFSCKKMRLPEKYDRVSLCSSCSLKLAHRWKKETNSDANVYELRENAEFKKWVESLYSVQ